MEDDQRITLDDVKALRHAAGELLYIGTKLMGSKEQKARFIEGKDRTDFVQVARRGELVGGTEKIRHRALSIADIADKIEGRLALY